MKKVVVFLASALLLATPMMAFAVGGIVGDCSDCHTMHNSIEGKAVAQEWDPATQSYTTSAEPIENLLKYDCISCHAMPGATDPTESLPGGSVVPQVSHLGTDDLAAGNFRYSTENQRKGHNVIDLTPADLTNAGTFDGTDNGFGAPPGNAHANHHGAADGVFTTVNDGTKAFDAFTCAGARGCHGTRDQMLSGSTGDWDGNAATANTFQGSYRTGIAAISGAHHNSADGLKNGIGYNGHKTDGSDPAIHDGAVVAAGYRFIPGLKGLGNTNGLTDTTPGDRWKNVDASSHNEYFGDAAGESVGESADCGTCHIQDNQSGGEGSRAALGSTLRVPNNSMSGFCATCHGVFHSMGAENGTSGAFLRHPSDWVIPNSGEYAAYTDYNVTAPVARPDLTAIGDSTKVRPGTDMVMCLSCHEAHASQYDFMLRFNYGAYDTAAGDYDGTGTMTAGLYNVGDAGSTDGCLACHTTKGIKK